MDNNILLENNSLTAEEVKKDAATSLNDEKNARRSYKNRRKYNPRYRKSRVPFVPKEDACGLPPRVAAVLAAGKRNLDDISKTKIRVFASEIYDIKRGKKVLDYSPANIRDLQYGFNSRRAALAAIFGTEKYRYFEIEAFHTEQLISFSDYVFETICVGLKTLLTSLDLNSFMSVERIVKAGNSIKNYGGAEVYGGTTVRDFLTYCAKKEKTVENKVSVETIKQIILSKESQFEEYKRIKSLPFALFDYKRNIKTDESGCITTPDLEAKKNLRIMLGSEYAANNFSSITLIEATAYESRLIHKIKKTATVALEQYINDNNEKVKTLPEFLQKDLLAAGNINLISAATKKCLVHEVVSRYEENFELITAAGEKFNEAVKNGEEYCLSDNEKKALFQIEYQVARTKPDIDFEYIADFGAFLNENEVKFADIESIIRVHNLM